MTQPSQSREAPGPVFPAAACVLLPKAVMRALVPNCLHDATWIAVSIAYVAQSLLHYHFPTERLATSTTYVIMHNASDNMIVRLIRARKMERWGRLLQQRLKDLTERFGFDSGRSIQDHFVEFHRNQQIMAESVPHASPSIASNTLDERQSKTASAHNLSIVNSVVQFIHAPHTHHSGNTHTTSATNSHNDNSQR
ncbi:hypothetical protein H0H92_012230 [Tricholoma furcatifolium]|nr:hypothetical protein H0H92_012230 [Tricholoma furcatifolium]